MALDKRETSFWQVVGHSDFGLRETARLASMAADGIFVGSRI
jgi:hypothetical protein